MIETYSYLDDKCKYYIYTQIFSTLLQIFPLGIFWISKGVLKSDTVSMTELFKKILISLILINKM